MHWYRIYTKINYSPGSMAFFNNKEIVFGKNEHGYEKKLIKKRRTIPVNYPTTPGKKVWFEKKYPRKEKFTTKLKKKSFSPALNVST